MIVKTLWGEELQESKVCKKCGVEKLVSEFQPRGDLSYVRGACKVCENKLSKERDSLKKSYHYPRDHRCDICKASEEEAIGRGGSKAKAFCIDHDHKTGKFRGYLCHDCNRALGQFGDSIEVLQNAIKYLEKPHKSLDSKNKLF